MSSVRDGLEQAVLISIGTAALTRERAEAAVAGLVRRGQITGDEGKKVVDRLMDTVKSGGAPASGMVTKIEDGLRGAFRELGVVTRTEHDELQQRITELEHRIALLEATPPNTPTAASGE